MTRIIGRLFLLTLLIVSVSCSKSKKDISPTVEEFCLALENVTEKFEKAESVDEMNALVREYDASFKVYENNTTYLTDNDREAILESFNSFFNILSEKFVELESPEVTADERMENVKKEATENIRRNLENAQTLGQFVKGVSNT